MVHEATIFFKKFLEQEKYKHSLSKHAMYSSSTGSEASIQLFEYARDKQEFKTESSRKHLALIAGNAIHSRRYFKAEKFHLIIGDLPYGISHGNKSQKKHNSLTRSPAELMEACLPEFHKILKTGGCLVLAWNKFVWPREDFVQLLNARGFHVQDSDPYDQFTHRVDQSIKRDIVVACKA
jgi:tRNA G10  N-methylase Trm11